MEPAEGLALPGESIYRVDTLRSRVGFSVRHALGRVQGVFTRVVGVVTFDPRKLDAVTARVTIQAASVMTHDTIRDSRLRSAGFLDARSFPQITFVSTGAQRSGGTLEVTGELTIHGITHPATVAVDRLRTTGARKEKELEARISARARARLRRLDFGVGPSSTVELGGLLIGDEVDIEMDLDLARI
jgi:polyisoprenoid-binding protein YceI